MLVTSEDIYDTKTLINYLNQHQDKITVKPARFEKGQILLSQGQQVEQLLFILEGEISLNRQTVHGRRFQLGTYKHNGFIGLMELFSEKPCFYTVYANTECTGYHLDTKQFTQLIYQTPELAKFVFKHITSKWYLSVEKMTRNILHTIKYCVIDELLSFDEQNPGEKLYINKTLESERIGTSIRVYNRVIKQLQVEDAIDVGRNFIRVRNRSLLTEILEREIDK
ncbi:Crp/Fnr family transcriptional regulator [Photobacterium sp. DNB23_23_1]|uniref:Crp/Fnr family transcriptional regulator n=1 Tax=Photobacterium pectinilyticum TaxID=2906793 RepID=A0ABT1N291_9GAMM|nr:Crp/Fnr family transcriptional regulator [Photobacterium sp. ZSDE20]MCQ1058850.1 Crp/Fnr family transcriptional regulator [Photobacterium sp. ZSDE20]MDD1823860.1 Crp/Fnr family transcriptional regulator [Photobacterium sp. ZSDE20]